MASIITPLFILKFIQIDWIRWFLLSSCWLPGNAWAHGFAQRYDLPIPLPLYLIGAASTVAVSFIVIALFVRAGVVLYQYPRLPLSRFLTFRLLAHKRALLVWRALSVLLLLLIIVAGWWGHQSPYKNIAPTLVWVIWWVGLAYCSGLIGNLWSVLNPWRNSFLFFEWLSLRCMKVKSLSLNLHMPEWLGVWPALVFFFMFSWIELVYENSDVPASIATLVFCYSLLTWLGMALFGREQWLQRGEAFVLVFGLLSRFSMTGQSAREGAGLTVQEEDKSWYLRPYGLGLLVEKPVSLSLTLFVVLMLSVVSFDGFMATPLWAAIVEWAIYSEFLRPLLVLLQPIFGDALSVISSLGFCVFPVLFTGIFYACCFLMGIFVRPKRYVTVTDMAGYFVMTLIPIALAYHLAHYLSFLLIVGQYMIPLISDPLGFGWDLFGTKHYFVDIGIVNARFVWITSVIAIVAGHIVAVFLSHVMAERIFKNQRQVLVSQIPMLILMVSYTMVSLWILAQPIVE